MYDSRHTSRKSTDNKHSNRVDIVQVVTTLVTTTTAEAHGGGVGVGKLIKRTIITEGLSHNERREPFKTGIVKSHLDLVPSEESLIHASLLTVSRSDSSIGSNDPKSF